MSRDCRSRRSKSVDRSKKGKYDRKRQMESGEKIEKAESLLVYLVRLLRCCYKRGKRVAGLIDHLLVMAEKTETGYYKLASLIGYDDECSEIASDKGLRSFWEVKPSTVLKFLCYDSTNNTKHQPGGQVPQQALRKRKDPKGLCFKFNGSGCSNSSCQFKHCCMFYDDLSHSSQGCRKGKSGQGSKN